MKRTVAVLSAVAALAGMVSASADTIGMSSTPYRAASGAGSGGGEFSANVLVGQNYEAQYSPLAIVGNGFATFCLERNESISLPGTYNFVENAAGAVDGGYAGGNPDPLSKGTAWLYCRFATGVLNYDYANTVSRAADAGLLQQAIWFLENEYLNLTYPENGGGANKYLNAAITQFGGTLTLARANDNGAQGVVALNLTKLTGAKVQDIVVYDPRVSDGGVTLVMLGAGLTGLALVRRRLA